MGITNQRETTVVWDKETGKAIHPAIVWQDRRTADRCSELRVAGLERIAADRTGLLLDPYFSATKIGWILDNVAGARSRAEAGKLAFGTIDSFLLWRLTDGKVHATDATNASRTLLYDIRRGEWDFELLDIFGVPAAMMPTVRDSSARFGETDPSHFGASIAICGIAGDQHAATVGQACFEPGMIKATFGTGGFAVLNTGETPVVSTHRLLTTIAYQLDGRPTYALEGSIFVAGAAVQWLRDGLGMIEKADQTGPWAEEADPAQKVYLVPAFTGLGAPWWDPDARGAMFGLTRNTGPREFACAALEAVCYQTCDLFDAMFQDWSRTGNTVLRVDGGMVASNWTMQRLADLLDVTVDRPVVLETTALGAAWLAGRQAGVWPDMAEFTRQWHLNRRFRPSMEPALRRSKLAGWRDAVQRTLVHRSKTDTVRP